MASPAKEGTGRKLCPVAPQLSAPPQAEVATPRHADAPGPPQAEVAAPPLPLARRVLAIGDVLDLILRSARMISPGSAIRRGLAVVTPLMWNALAGLQRTIPWASLLAIADWIKTWRSRRSPSPAATAAVVECQAKKPKKGKRRPEKPLQERGNQAWYQGFARPRPEKPLPAAAVAPAVATPPPPHRPAVVVGGEAVAPELVEQYARYCKFRSNCQWGKTVCHLCIIEDDKYYNYKFPNSKMADHCWSIHETPGLPCEDSGCRVIVRTPRELVLHTHYCHVLPSGWWK